MRMLEKNYIFKDNVDLVPNHLEMIKTNHE